MRAFLGRLQPQLAFVVALMQVAGAALKLRAFERAPVAIIGSNLRSIRCRGELRVGPEISRDLLGLHLVHAQRVGLERWIRGFKLRLYLVPGKGLLRRARWPEPKQAARRSLPRQRKE